MSKENVKVIRRPFAGYERSHNVAEDAELTHVGPGTPCGEFMRRIWQPVALSSELNGLPLTIRMLGEDLVLFRTRKGQPGLLARHCSHRGASLEYGRPTDEGIQCCYHGWHYAVDGTILETPNDPDSQIKDKLCHGAYPTHEYKGIIFAYMGPPDDVPAFAILDSYDQPDTDFIPFSLYFACNWLQVLDNTQDPTHSCFLHTRVSGTQFAESWGELPELDYVPTPYGMVNVNVRRWKDRIWVRTTEMMLPNVNQAGAMWLTAEKDVTFIQTALTRWMRPIDDAHTQMIGWRYFNDRVDPDHKGVKEDVGLGKIDFIGQTEDERPYRERQQVPGDYEAIVSQRPIAVHALENFNRGDRGVAMMRKLIRTNIRAVGNGEPYSSYPRDASGTVPTYTVDTVVTVPENGGDDRALMRSLGERISKITFDSSEFPIEKREVYFAERLADLMENIPG